MVHGSWRRQRSLHAQQHVYLTLVPLLVVVLWFHPPNPFSLTPTKAPPNMGGYIMDFMAPRIRKFACIVLFKAYRPALSLELLCRLLAFENEAQALEFLQKLEVEVESSGKIDCRKATQALASKDSMLKLGPS